MGFDIQNGIVAQNSATAAAAIYASLGRDTFDANEYETIRSSIFEGTLALADVEGVVQSFDTPKTARTTSAPRGNGGGGSSDAGAGIELKFGKHAGKTIGAVYTEDPEWLEWYSENGNVPFIKAKAGEYLASVA